MAYEIKKKKVKLPDYDKVAVAFYNEDWDYFKKVFGKKPKNHLEEENIMEKWKVEHLKK